MLKTLRVALALVATAIVPACLPGDHGSGGDPDGDPGPAGTLQFGSASYEFIEGGVYLGRPIVAPLITVTRTGGSEGAVSVMVVVTGGSATPDVDYHVNVPGPLAGVVLSWADGETGPKAWSFTILDDAIAEIPETIELQLVNVTGGASLGAIDKATITIQDDETSIVAPTSP